MRAPRGGGLCRGEKAPQSRERSCRPPASFLSGILSAVACSYGCWVSSVCSSRLTLPLRPFVQGLGDQLRDLRRVRRGPDPGALQGLALCLGGALAAGDDGARVAHRLALRGGEA